MVDYPAGLHARPATSWVEAARATGCRIQVRSGDQATEATALVGLLQLGLRAGDRITVSAEGREAAAALAKLRAAITGLSAQEKADAALAAQRATAPARGWEPAGRLVALAGIGASPGLAIGRVHVLANAEATIPDAPLPLAEGGARLEDAIRATHAHLKALEDDTARRLGPGEAAIFRAHAGLLDDPDLITITCQLMVEGHGLAWSWHQAVERVAGSLAALGNPVLAGRAADLRDVGRRVLGQIDPSLVGGSLAELPEGPVILVADDLSPSDTAGLDAAKVVGLATATGGPTSHTAILARTLGIPALVAGGRGCSTWRRARRRCWMAAPGGCISTRPRPISAPPAAGSPRSRSSGRGRRRCGRTGDHRRRRPHRGVGQHRPARRGRPRRGAGGEGIGLMRSEFLFLERDAPPGGRAVRAYRGVGRGAGRPAADRPHARHRRRQGGAVSRHAGRGKPFPRRARHPALPRLSRSVQDAVAGDLPRRRARAGARSCIR